MDRLSPDAPVILGSYRLLSLLGKGGMGRVYLARPDNCGPDTAPVAVKLIRADLTDPADKQSFRRRFSREVAAARKVNGEWTARVLDADTSADVPWVATEYVRGPSLRAVVAGDFGALPSASVLVLADRLALALRAIHQAGLIHRDLKPSNILLTVDGPRVIDFGIAHSMDASLESTLTRTGSLIGTPEFMSPEQVRGERVTPASDIFSLGSVIAYAATGHSPFRGEESQVHALMFRIAYEDPDLTELPESIEELVRACLAKDPTDRPTVPEILAHTRHAPAGAWLPDVLLTRLDRVAARPLLRPPMSLASPPETSEPADTCDEPEFLDFPDPFPEPSEALDPAARHDPLNAPESGIKPPAVRHQPLPRRTVVGRRLVAVAVAVAGALSTALGVWVATPAVGMFMEGGDADGADQVSEDPPEGVSLSGAEILDRGGAWSMGVYELGGQKPYVLSIDLADARRPRYIAATSHAVCSGRFGGIDVTKTALLLSRPTQQPILPKDLSADRCPRVLDLHLSAEAKNQDTLTWKRWGITPFSLGRVSSPGTPIPARFLGTRKKSEGWTVTVHHGTVGSIAVSGIRDAEGRHCVMSAVVMNTTAEFLRASPAQLDPKRSDAGCEVPRSAGFEYIS
ncbi:serine/threonine-protein kinase [Streptomyces sp. ATCC 21386]|uniref:serine/threonine-protein kinase n=1 Tax=Streptomyces sp. ATCC 21386 TaxID=2699428 RepID=UPI001BFF9ED8|nr:serine/threonine-protein kinase [Streptomyces sp. ATCC 21386]